MKIPVNKVISAIAALIACAALFAWATWQVVEMFTETSYKITAVFLSLILLSNVMAKICIYTINRHGTSI